MKQRRWRKIVRYYHGLQVRRRRWRRLCRRIGSIISEWRDRHK